MSLPLPEQKPVQTVLRSTLLGLLEEFPGGSALAGVIEGVAQAASRQRDEEWWAMLAARVKSLEVEVQTRVRFDDPQFIAATHRMLRAAQASADESQREAYAAAAADGGSWSDLPQHLRDLADRTLLQLTPREIELFKIFMDPRKWLSTDHPEELVRYRTKDWPDIRTLVKELIEADQATYAERVSVGFAISHLESLGLVSISSKDSKEDLGNDPDYQLENHATVVRGFVLAHHLGLQDFSGFLLRPAHSES